MAQIQNTPERIWESKLPQADNMMGAVFNLNECPNFL